ncbi:unnamed protein product [Calicophoron daubneyi]|uniref:EGF-like domain-containing protein n=1 Tax=Calicophoron daubneyi TaxID=300641 RepID=A0AAV2TP39_CALDB
MFVAVLFLLCTLSLLNCHDYYAEQEKWPVNIFFKCHGTPKLKAQRVHTIPEAAQIYYSTLMSGRFPEDKQLDTCIPPASILKLPIYQELFDMVINSNHHASLMLMKIGCHLFNNQEWVKTYYNQALGRNTDTFRAILDIIYRFALCFQNVDPHLNCPDVCASKPPDFCKNVPHAIDACSSYLDESFRKINWNESANREAAVRDWYRQVPIDRRLPIEFLVREHDKLEDIERKLEIQKMAARKAYCPCQMYYVYDRFLEGCVDITQDFGCGGGNPCANGGRCVPKTVWKRNEEGDLEEVPTFSCICPPAFRGETCEQETDRCAEGDVCGGFQCIRDPNDLDNGYRCLCPPKYKRKSPGEPICVPLPACGEKVVLGANDTSALSNPSATHQPCLNGGHCVQDPNDPTIYTCGRPQSFTGISPLKRKRMLIAAEHCDIATHSLIPISEEDLDEQLLGIEALDDWNIEGLEEAPMLNLPRAILQGDLQAVNWPKAQDLLFITMWIYAVIVHIALVILWIYHIHRWRTFDMEYKKE